MAKPSSSGPRAASACASASSRPGSSAERPLPSSRRCTSATRPRSRSSNSRRRRSARSDSARRGSRGRRTGRRGRSGCSSRFGPATRLYLYDFSSPRSNASGEERCRSWSRALRATAAFPIVAKSTGVFDFVLVWHGPAGDGPFRTDRVFSVLLSLSETTRRRRQFASSEHRHFPPRLITRNTAARPRRLRVHPAHRAVAAHLLSASLRAERRLAAGNAPRQLIIFFASRPPPLPNNRP